MPEHADHMCVACTADLRHVVHVQHVNHVFCCLVTRSPLYPQLSDAFALKEEIILFHSYRSDFCLPKICRRCAPVDWKRM